MAWLDVAASEDLKEGDVIGVRAGRVPVALFRLEGEVFALHDLCPHGAARLSDGYVDDECVECPLHQGLVDIRTGDPKGPPIDEPTQTYPAREVNGRIEVDVD